MTQAGAAPIPPSSWKRLTVSGLRWNFLASFLKQLLNFVIGVILARLLSPSDFGLVGMVAVFTGFASVFMGQGFGAAIIQRQDLDGRHLDSIFWMNAFLGLLCTALLWCASPWIAEFYKCPALQPITVLISLNFFIGSLSIVQTALLDKAMDFRRVAIIDTVSVVCAGAVALFLAKAGYGVWSLVGQSLVLSLTAALTLWITSAWRPGCRFSIASIKDVFGFSANLIGSNLLNFLFRNFDNLLIGRFLSAVALGIYMKAYQLMLLPLSQISWVISRVMFPSLSSIQDDPQRIKKVYLAVLRAIALISFPFMIGLFVLSELFVLTVFGSKWSAMIPIVRIFCLAGLLDSITTTVGWIYQSRGRTDIQFKWGAIETGILLGAFAVGLRWGITGVALSYLLSNYLILWYPSWALPGKLIHLTFSEMLSHLWGTFFCSLAMGVLVWLVGYWIPLACPHWMRLFIQMLFGILVYVVLVHVVRIRGYLEIRGLIAGAHGQTT